MNCRTLKKKSLRRLALATLTACAALASGCSMLAPRRGVTVLGDGRKNYYAAGEPVDVPAAANTNGLWVLTPQMLESMVLEAPND